MAKRRGIIDLFVHAEEDARPIGALRFADPSKAEFPRHIHTFNEPHSNVNRPVAEQHGIRSTTGNMVPWDDRHTHDSWAAMNAKRGVTDTDERD